MGRNALSAFVWVMLGAGAALAQTTAFTYQGQLTDAGQPANGSFDLQLKLFDTAVAGTQIGSTQTLSAVAVSGGIFTVQLDFGTNAFPGDNRFLEIGVRPAAAGSFTTLAPRQQISSTPYAIRTLSATTADALSSACVGCVKDTQIQAVAGSKVSGAIPAASVPAGSGNYVQNTTTPQANANFNISGNGTVGGDLTVNGTLNANVSGNFIQNRTTQQGNANFNVSGNGTVGQTLAAGKVGVGTAAPASPLDVAGTGWFQGDSTPLVGGGAGTGVGFNANGGYVFAYDYGTATPRNLLLNNPGGKVGIGTLTPASTLDVQAGTLDGIRGHSASSVGVSGFSTSVYGVYGQTTAAHTTFFSGVFGISSGDGGVGVIGEADTGNAWGVYGKSASSTGIGVIGEADTGSGMGVYGTSTSLNGYGVYGANLSGGFAMGAAGNVTQNLDNGGWVKAMVHITINAVIDRCYNSFNHGSAATTPPCGFSISRANFQTMCLDQGPETLINFGFPVANRFWSVTPERDFTNVRCNNQGQIGGGVPISNIGVDAGTMVGLDGAPLSPTELLVDTFYSDQRNNLTNAAVTVIIY